MQAFIDISKVHFSYRQSNQDPLLAVQDVSLQIAAGSHVAILGRNGSGKSTLARLINALEQPSQGIVLVSGRNTAQEENVWEIRRLCGMVFQNPDNQIVGTTVEEDVAFGPENLGSPSRTSGWPLMRHWLMSACPMTRKNRRTCFPAARNKSWPSPAFWR